MSRESSLQSKNMHDFLKRQDVFQKTMHIFCDKCQKKWKRNTNSSQTHHKNFTKFLYDFFMKCKYETEEW